MAHFSYNVTFLDLATMFTNITYKECAVDNAETINISLKIKVVGASVFFPHREDKRKHHKYAIY